MKKSNIFVIVFLCALTVASWCVFLGNQINTNQEYNANVKEAKQYEEEGLYQKAIKSWEKALALKDNLKGRADWIDACEAAFNDGVLSAATYEENILLMCEQTEGDPFYWEKLLQHYLDTGAYNDAYEFYNTALKNDVKSDVITELGDVVRYMVRTTAKPYVRIRQNASGYYCVFDGKKWGIVNSDGETFLECKYDYLSPYSAEQYYLQASAKGQRLVGFDNTVEKIIEIDYLETGAYGSGMIPLCTAENRWSYYSLVSEEMLPGTYEMASNYQNGVAAIKKNGKWTLIDTNAQAVCDTAFDDIKLHSGGDYASNGIMIASVAGKYNIYNSNGELRADVAATDMDIAKNGSIAYKDSSGKWGYVDADGAVVIEPQYEQAKSFSGGLAAVCIDGLWGFIKSSGKVVIEPTYFDAGYFTDHGVCFVSIYQDVYHKLELRF